MSITLETFINKIANTLDKIEILNFFNENPGAIDSAEGIGQWISKKKEDILQDLDELVDDGVLVRESSGNLSLYRYSPPKQIRNLISDLLSTKKFYEDKIRKLERERNNLEDQFLREIVREKSKTKTIIESMREGVMVLNKNLQLLSINQVAKNIFAIKEEEHLGKKIYDIVADKEKLQKIEKILAIDKHREKFDEDFFLVCHHNTIYRVNLSFLKEDGDGKEFLGYILIFNDITKEKEMEKIKADFISMFTHDLKNPLNTIILNSTFLLEKFQIRGDNSEVSFLKMINENGRRILKIIENFLSVSMIEAGMLKLNLEEVNYEKLLSVIIYTFSTQAKDKGLQIESKISPGLPLLRIDRLQIERVLDNILSNAIKFTPEGGKIKIIAFQKDNSIFTSVSDTGIGISKDDLPNLFDKYYRSQGATNIKGTGLGLSIVKSVIDAHKGKITVESEEGKGTTFTFQIPVGK